MKLKLFTFCEYIPKFGKNYVPLKIIHATFIRKTEDTFLITKLSGVVVEKLDKTHSRENQFAPRQTIQFLKGIRQKDFCAQIVLKNFSRSLCNRYIYYKNFWKLFFSISA